MLSARTSKWLRHMAIAAVGLVGAAVFYRYAFGSWMSGDYCIGILAGSGISAWNILVGDTP